MPSIFDPIKIGRSELSHRLVLAPLTRYRANLSHVHGDLAVEYYSQRASVPGTLLITEATFISARAGGDDHAPGIYTADQIAAWKRVTDAVHAKGSFIFCQLWALGRVAQKEVLEREVGPGWLVSSSAVPMEEGAETPRELTEDEIWSYIGDYAQAGKNAIEAGFDGVEIHGANGYLIDQFTQDTCNRRTDSWGGTIANRSRFGLEIAKAVIDAVGADRTGMRLSPFSDFQGMLMTDPVPQFSHLIQNLKNLHLSYLHLVESRVSGNADVEGTHKIDFAVEIWGKTTPVLLAGGFQPESARNAIEEKYKEYQVLVVFGRYFISNPDLVFRVKKGLALSRYNRETFYVPESREGYVDYPFSREFEEELVERGRDREEK